MQLMWDAMVAACNRKTTVNIALDFHGTGNIHYPLEAGEFLEGEEGAGLQSLEACPVQLSSLQSHCLHYSKEKESLATEE